MAFASKRSIIRNMARTQYPVKQKVVCPACGRLLERRRAVKGQPNRVPAANPCDPCQKKADKQAIADKIAQDLIPVAVAKNEMPTDAEIEAAVAAAERASGNVFAANEVQWADAQESAE